jgi:hypothetical protein
MDWIQPIVKSWLATIKKANDYKRTEFQDDAEEAMRFFDGPHDFMYAGEYVTRHGGWGSDDHALPNPTFRMTFNKVAEMVQLFGPFLYHRNPHRQVTPSDLPDLPLQMMADQNDPQSMQELQQFQQTEQAQTTKNKLISDLVQHYLNYTPNELDLRGNSRQAIDEAVIKGMGLLWPEVYTPPGGAPRMVGSFYDSVDNLVVDPDMENLLHAKFIARRRVLPTYEVERRFGLKDRTLRGNLESLKRQGQISHADDDYQYYRARGDTCDLFVYWEVYSRIGMGHHLRDYNDRRDPGPVSKRLDNFGQYIFLAISDDYAYPLNIPEKIAENGTQRDIFLRSQWPTPFWADPTNPWPFVDIAFHRRPRKVWPMSHVKPGLGEIRFLNWGFSFIADKIKNTSRDFVAALKSAGEELRTNILSGKDLTLLEIETPNQRIQDVVQFLQHPEMNRDIWAVMESMMSILERRIGLNELMYGESSRQLRSASEAQIKGDQLRIRPDDMAEQVEAAMTLLARKEAIAAYWHLTGEDVTPVLGEQRAQIWDGLIKQQDLSYVVTELNYRIEAGSIRKPNRNRDQENANSAVQMWTPLLQGYFQMTGDPRPINGLSEMWAKANDMEPDLFQLQPPPPPEPDQGEQQKAQLEQQKMQAELQMKQAEMQLKMMEKQEDMKLKQQELSADLQFKQRDHQMEMFQDQEEHDQEMSQDREQHLLDMLQTRQEGMLKLDLAEKQGEQQRKTMAAQAKAKPTNGAPKKEK